MDLKILEKSKLAQKNAQIAVGNAKIALLTVTGILEVLSSQLNRGAITTAVARELLEKAYAPLCQTLSVGCSSGLPRDESGLVGGLSGVTHWGWCYIRHFWVEENFRSRGVGRRLLAHAEMEARARQCVGLYLDTFDPGAAQFYERCGFLRFGQIDDFPPGHARAFLYKKLPAS
jgi:GNAT superfamily N-acetyltransferase